MFRPCQKDQNHEDEEHRIMKMKMPMDSAVESDEDDWNSSGLLLSNVDRHQRALRSHIGDQPRMGVSMKAIPNAQIPKYRQKHLQMK